MESMKVHIVNHKMNKYLHKKDLEGETNIIDPPFLFPKDTDLVAMTSCGYLEKSESG